MNIIPTHNLLREFKKANDGKGKGLFTYPYKKQIINTWLCYDK